MVRMNDWDALARACAPVLSCAVWQIRPDYLPSAFFYPCTRALQTHWIDAWDAALVYDALAHGLGES
jgi:hypothetical protein